MTRRIGSNADKTFTGKVAFVTGGSRGIGAGIVRRLARDGASVAFTYSSSEEKALQLARDLESAGGKALALKADSASARELRAAVARTTQALGPLDIFVSNAGILTMGTIDRYSLEDFDRMVAINIRAAFRRYSGSRPRNERRRPDGSFSSVAILLSALPPLAEASTA